VSSDLVKKLGLTTRSIPHPYYLEWFNNCGKTKVTKSARIHFSVGSYRAFADFDVVPMQSSSLLLGRPWEFDTDATHHGRTNTYTLMHKDKKITLLPLSPADIRKHFKEHAENVSNKSSDAKPNGIKLKEGVYIATTSAAAELCDNHDAPCYTMLCRYETFPNASMSCTMHPAVTNLL